MQNLATTKLKQLLLDNQKLDPSYGKELFSNHLSMSLIALFFLKASTEKLEQFYTDYSKRLTPLDVKSALTINTSNWQEYLGKKYNHYAYHQFFKQQHQELGTQKLLAYYLPILSSGMGAALFHPLIRLAYAIELLNYAHIEKDSELEKVASDEITISLAYWANFYLPIKPIPSGTVFEDNLALTMAKDKDILTVYASNLTQLYTKHPNFVRLHFITSLHALRIVLPFAPSDSALAQDYWQALLNTDMRRKLPDKNIINNQNLSLDKIYAGITKLYDEHDIKLTYSALSEYKHYNNEDYLKIASYTILNPTLAE